MPVLRSKLLSRCQWMSESYVNEIANVPVHLVPIKYTHVVSTELP